MPTYEYLCDAHGAFTAFKPVSRYQEPEPCPECSVASPRVVLTAPAVQGAGGGKAQPDWMAGMRRHAAGCKCC